MPDILTVERSHPKTRAWRADRLDAHLLSLVEPASMVTDQYRALRYMVGRRPEPNRLIAVTSAAAGDGKTTTAINLAAVLGQAPDTRVLVIDFDLRTSAVASRLGLPQQTRGLVDVLVEPALTPDDVVWRHPELGLAALPAGRSVSVPYELLQSPRLRTLLDDLRRQYDYVVLDTPPIALVPDTRLIADQVDGFILVIAAHRTPRALFAEAMNLMDPAKLIGIVFNGDDQPLAGYYGSYQGYYGRRRRDGRRGRGRVPQVLRSE